jgi:hypothetical protein
MFEILSALDPASRPLVVVAVSGLAACVALAAFFYFSLRGMMKVVNSTVDRMSDLCETQYEDVDPNEPSGDTEEIADPTSTIHLEVRGAPAQLVAKLGNRVVADYSEIQADLASPLSAAKEPSGPEGPGDCQPESRNGQELVHAFLGPQGGSGAGKEPQDPRDDSESLGEYRGVAVLSPEKINYSRTGSPLLKYATAAFGKPPAVVGPLRKQPGLTPGVYDDLFTGRAVHFSLLENHEKLVREHNQLLSSVDREAERLLRESPSSTAAQTLEPSEETRRKAHESLNRLSRAEIGEEVGPFYINRIARHGIVFDEDFNGGDFFSPAQVSLENQSKGNPPTLEFLLHIGASAPNEKQRVFSARVVEDTHGMEYVNVRELYWMRVS